MGTGSLRHAFRLSPLYHPLRPLAERIELWRWDRRGRPAPAPHLVKSRAVIAYARRFARTSLVETGTYHGAMVADTIGVFPRIHSIELDPALFANAKRRFRRLAHVQLWPGDSGSVLPEILARLTEPALFWLDAHHSGGFTARGSFETPIRAELDAILAAIAEPVILIDDAHLFTGRCDYPTLDEVRELIAARLPGFAFVIENNIVRIHPLD